MEEREKLFCLIEQGVSLREIGRLLDRSDITLGRELKRNKTGQGKVSNEYLSMQYLPCKAQIKAIKRGIKTKSKSSFKGNFNLVLCQRIFKASIQLDIRGNIRQITKNASR